MNKLQDDPGRFSRQVLELLGPPARAPQALKLKILRTTRSVQNESCGLVAPGALVAGKYRIIDHLGGGGMGSVWSARNEATARDVALKLIARPEPELRYRLQCEARALGSLEHRHIINIYDVDQTDTGTPFLVMELLHGETVTELLARKRRLAPPTAARIGRDIAKALSAAHALKIIHRDLKPANVFLHQEPGEGEPVVKVLDFGIAKDLSSHESLQTTLGNVVGSLCYMSPEQAQGQADIDHRTDLWALGVLLFEMLTGQRPFEGNAQEVFAGILRGEITMVDRDVLRMDPDLVQVVARCTRRNREERFQSAAEVAAMLERFVSAPDSIISLARSVGWSTSLAAQAQRAASGERRQESGAITPPSPAPAAMATAPWPAATHLARRIVAGSLLAGRYRLLRPLGTGAMGVVWAAVNEMTLSEVAIKLLGARQPELRQRLLREARSCGQLKHRNIIDVYDVAMTEDGEPFLVMQLLQGETLAQRLKRLGRFEPAEAASIARDIARALTVAHAKHIIHRDLKPANIFLQEEEAAGFVVKVLDFGVSKNLATSDGLYTAVGAAIGSPPYMSPEQVKADPAVDHRTDLWSLGVVLFEMLAGTRLFKGAMPEVLLAVTQAPLPRLAQFVRGVDHGLARVVDRCLERRLEARIASAAELAMLLDPYAAPAELPPAGEGRPSADTAAHAARAVSSLDAWAGHAATPTPRAATGPRAPAAGPHGAPSAPQAMHDNSNEITLQIERRCIAPIKPASLQGVQGLGGMMRSSAPEQGLGGTVRISTPQAAQIAAADRRLAPPPPPAPAPILLGALETIQHQRQFGPPAQRIEAPIHSMSRVGATDAALVAGRHRTRVLAAMAGTVLGLAIVGGTLLALLRGGNKPLEAPIAEKSTATAAEAGASTAKPRQEPQAGSTATERRDTPPSSVMPLVTTSPTTAPERTASPATPPAKP